MTVTLKQIAREVGMDISTVSRVLNKPEQARASAESRARITAVARQMGYQAHAGAQALVRGRTGCVGILVPDLLDPVLASYVHRLDGLLREQHLQAIPLPTGWSPSEERRSLEALRRRQVDAVIGLYYQPENAGLYQQLRQQGHQLIFRVVDQPIEAIDVNCVGIDIADAYDSLIRHLAERGYRRIGIVGGFVAEHLAQGRSEIPAAQYVLAAHEGAGILFDRLRAVPCGNSAEEAGVALGAILREAPDQFDALVVQSSKLLLGVWRALTIAGLSVPSRVGLASVSDSEVCRLLPVPVTVWDQPIDRICDGLVSTLSRPESQPGLVKLQYASRLVVRESTRGPA